MDIRYTNPLREFTCTIDDADMRSQWKAIHDLIYDTSPATTNPYHRDPNVVEGSVVSVRDADDEEGV